MNAHLLLAEFLRGIELYAEMGISIESGLKTNEGVLFFIRHEHQVAYDSGYAVEFAECFPNFHEYCKHEQIFLDWVESECQNQ